MKKEAVTVTDTAATAEVLVKDTLTYTTEETPVEALAQTEEVPVMEEVVVETKTTANTSAKKVQNIAPGEVVSGTFYVIIGSFKNESNADKLYSKLTDSGKQVVKLPVDANGFYKVAVGSFESLEKANSEMANLEPSYSGIWVKKY